MSKAASKAAQARIRQDLLHHLYAATLRGTLACARAGLPSTNAAFAAGLAENLRAGDMVLTPARGGEELRVLRGLPPRSSARDGEAADLKAGVLRLPKAEAAAVALVLDVTASYLYKTGALACVLLPKTIPLQPAPSRRAGTLPRTWGQAASYAAKNALPLLFATVGKSAREANGPAAAAHRCRAPLYPTIPVDRADALAVYRVAFECAARARAGLGPSQITGVGFRPRGQQQDEAGALERLEMMLRRLGAFTKAAHRRLERAIQAELEART